MNRIAICIPTYKRPLMLKNLILSINKCKIDKSFIAGIYVIIMDNDIEKTAEEAVSDFMNMNSGFMDIFYHNYPQKGLSNVRNELLKEALILNTDFIIFIDDDEYASVEWLNELVKSIVTNNCDMVMGPVISDFENGVTESISRWIQRPIFKDNSVLNSIATNNLIIKTESLLRFGIRFDNRFNKTGAEDSYFGEQMLKQGAKAYWAEKAIVYETVTKDRARLSWLMKRYYNAANTYTFILKLEKHTLKLILKIFMSLIYIILGICAFMLILFPFKLRYWGIIKLSEGLGGIAGLLSISYYEYE